MARSPDSAKAKDAAAEAVNKPAKDTASGRYLKAPDGFVYRFTEALARQPGFVEFAGDVDAAGFAKE